eukprot:scaffold144856_cov32-Prasinocladus_malaysianus.AAC.1
MHVVNALDSMLQTNITHNKPTSISRASLRSSSFALSISSVSTSFSAIQSRCFSTTPDCGKVLRCVPMMNCQPVSLTLQTRSDAKTTNI